MSERIALFGGTFNPIHCGHLTVARAVADRLALSRLVLMPSARPPHKPAGDLAAGEDRLAMCRLAAEIDPRLVVSDLELHRPPPSYTVDTLAALGRDSPSAKLLLVIGADMLRDFHLWYRFEDIARTARIVTVPRPGVEIGSLAALRRALGEAAVEGILADLQDTPLVDVSSTEIRRRLLAGQSVADLVPPAVARYIVEHGLYR